MNMLSLFAATDTLSISNLLSNGAKTLTGWGGWIIVILGLAALLVAGVMTFRGLTSQKAQTSWGKVIILYVVAGVFLFGGISGVMDLSEGANNTIKALSAGNSDGYSNDEDRYNDVRKFKGTITAGGEHIAILPDGSTIEF